MAAVLVVLMVPVVLEVQQGVVAVVLRRRMVLPLDDEVVEGNPEVKRAVVGMVALFKNFSNWQCNNRRNSTHLVGDLGYNIFEDLVEVEQLAVGILPHILGCDDRIGTQVESASLMHPRDSHNHDKI
jgi:hypothetical protein